VADIAVVSWACWRKQQQPVAYGRVRKRDSDNVREERVEEKCGKWVKAKKVLNLR